ncbi:unnamed protein product [Mycena citricolor]|uniref:Uncharacterized protein n=1 Tax=Mycena citricolor TaxID=2018698 RepID=A0AAD2Q594_9AGAR|nr:unnamed protein product [Mycena citricolor]
MGHTLPASDSVTLLHAMSRMRDLEHPGASYMEMALSDLIHDLIQVSGSQPHRPI